jgi:hypothetical protein
MLQVDCNDQELSSYFTLLAHHQGLLITQWCRWNSRATQRILAIFPFIAFCTLKCNSLQSSWHPRSWNICVQLNCRWWSMQQIILQFAMLINICIQFANACKRLLEGPGQSTMFHVRNADHRLTIPWFGNENHAKIVLL